MNSGLSFLGEMLTDLNAPNNCAAIRQKYRSEHIKRLMILMFC